MDHKIIDTAWRSYSEQVLPDNAPDTQRTECRRAFFAGAQTLFVGITEALDPGIEPTEAEIERITAIDDELNQYLADVVRGDA